MRSRRPVPLALAAAIAGIGLSGLLPAPAWEAIAAQGNRSLAPYVPTPQDVVDRMLDLAGVTADDVVYDLGCGDGRIVITAAQRFGARRVRIHIDTQRIAE